MSHVTSTLKTKSRPDTQIYRTNVVWSTGDFIKLSDEWQALLEALPEKNLYWQNAWLFNWLNHFPPQQLMVILVWDAADNLVGVAPFQIVRNSRGLAQRFLRRVQFMGTEPTVYDWMKILCHPDADTEAVLEQISLELVKHKSRWDIIDLRFCPDTQQLLCLEKYLMPVSVGASVEAAMPIPYIDLPETIEAYVEAGHKKGIKRNIKSAQKQLLEDFPNESLKLEVLAPGKNTRKILDHFFEGYLQYWREKRIKPDLKRFSRLHAFYRSSHLLFYRNWLSNNRFQLTVLKLGSQILSYHLGSWQSDTYTAHLCHYNKAFTQYRPGLLHMETLIHAAIANGAKRFEFGRGDALYKSQWTRQQTALWNLRIVRHPLASILWQLDERLRGCLKSIGQRK